MMTAWQKKAAKPTFNFRFDKYSQNSTPHNFAFCDMQHDSRADFDEFSAKYRRDHRTTPSRFPHQIDGQSA
jgi:hypothetical protein